MKVRITAVEHSPGVVFWEWNRRAAPSFIRMAYNARRLPGSQSGTQTLTRSQCMECNISGIDMVSWDRWRDTSSKRGGS